MKTEQNKVLAIVLAGGKGKRMGAQVSKQYLELNGKPLLYYTLCAFEESIVQDVILVCGAGEEEYCGREIVSKYGLKKVKKIVPGGKERYDSVYEGLKAAKKTEIGRDADIVLIHDGARAFVTPEIIQRVAEMAEQKEACVVGMPVKDTVKVARDDLTIESTPDRTKMWQIQTPQAFRFHKIFDAYNRALEDKVQGITDDAMVWEYCYEAPVYLTEGDYSNIKVTTPEDMAFGDAILNQRKK